MRLILQDRFCVEDIPDVCMVRFKFLAKLPLDHIAQPVVYIVFNWNNFVMRFLNLRIVFFYLLRTFCPHLGSFRGFFCVVSSFTTFRPNFTSGLLQVIYCDLG